MEKIDPIGIRGHTLLCLQGFRGEGYSAEFIENMSKIHRQLTHHPEQPVLILDSPDSICSQCPKLKSQKCNLNGPASEESMMAQDADVMNRLGIGKGEILSWKEILDRIAQRLQGDILSDICGTCPWLPLGYCNEGIQYLVENRSLKPKD